MNKRIITAFIIIIGFIMAWTILILLPPDGVYSVFNLVPGIRLPDPPADVVQSSFHHYGYENAWIQFVEEQDDLVQVETVGSKIVILFRPKKEVFHKFNIGWITPVTIQCTTDSRNNSTDCELGPQHRLYIENDLVELVQLKFLRKTRKLEIPRSLTSFF